MAIAVSFLFSPAPKNDTDLCGKYIHLTSHVGFVINCDAPGYCINSRDLSLMLGASPERQSRPLYLIAGGIIGRPIQWVLDRVHIPLLHKLGDYPASFAGYYVAYIILNFLLLVLALYLFESIIFRIAGQQVNRWMLLAFEILLVSNQVTKAFFWTAHQQFFTLFTPLLTIWLLLRIADKKMDLKKTAVLSLLCGMLMLAYGDFVPMFLCIVWAGYHVNKKMVPAALLWNSLLFALPSLLWIGSCIYRNGYYYNQETERFREVVWITDALKISFTHFLSVAFKSLIVYLETFKEIIFFIAAAFLFYIGAKPIKENSTKEFPKMCLVAFFSFFLFFYVVGHYRERTTYTMYPIVLCMLLVAVMQTGWLRNKPAIFLLIAFGWHLYNVLSYGPFS